MARRAIRAAPSKRRTCGVSGMRRRRPELRADTETAWHRLSARMQATQGPSPVSLHHARSSGTAPALSLAAVDVACPRVDVRRCFARAGRCRDAGVAGIARSGFVAARAAHCRADRARSRVPHGARDSARWSSSATAAASSSAPRARCGCARSAPARGKCFSTVRRCSTSCTIPPTSFSCTRRTRLPKTWGRASAMRAYPADVRVEVFVSSGKVNLRAVGAPERSGTLLGPLDFGVLDSTGHATVRNGVDSTAHLAWTHDRFVFSNVPLERCTGGRRAMVRRARRRPRFRSGTQTRHDERSRAVALGRAWRSHHAPRPALRNHRSYGRRSVSLFALPSFGALHVSSIRAMAMSPRPLCRGARVRGRTCAAPRRAIGARRRPTGVRVGAEDSTIPAARDRAIGNGQDAVATRASREPQARRRTATARADGDRDAGGPRSVLWRRPRPRRADGLGAHRGTVGGMRWRRRSPAPNGWCS